MAPTTRPQQYRLRWPLSPSQLEGMDEMFEALFRGLRSTTDTASHPSAESVTGAGALTKTDDTNVTLTLGGTPTTALLRAVSLTLGWTGTLAVSRGGTAADLSTTGGAGNYLKQTSAGAAITVGTIPASDIVSGAALTRVNDTNVTLTLGGTPTAALLAATSLTLGWTGTLGLSRGGTNADLSATGGSGKVLKQVTLGAAVTVAALTAAEITSGAALTKVDDTNVTLTLGGTPASALLAAASLTLGWTGTLGLSRGGTNADLSATGGAGKILKQVTLGAAVTVATLTAAEIASGAALTKVDDTNVTLTLGGTPASALLAAASLTLGWTGTLAVARGGIGVGTLASNGVLYGAGTSAVNALAVNSTATKKFLTQTSSAAPAWDTLVAADLPSTSVNASAYRATNQTLTHNTEAAITLSNTDFDSGTMWAIGNPTRLTVPASSDGAYFVHGCVKLAAGFKGTSHLRIYKNAVLVTEQSTVGADLASNAEYHHVSSVVSLVATDYVELKVVLELSAGTGTYDVTGGSGNTYLQAGRLAPQVGAASSAGSSTGAFSARPAAATSGLLYFPNDGMSVARDSGSAWAQFGPLFPLTKPDDTAFAWINQGGAAVTADKDAIYFLAPATTGTSWRVRKKTLGASTRVEIGFLPHLIGSGTQVGLVLRESGTGKLATFALGDSVALAIQHWASATVFTANDVTGITLSMRPVIWLAMSISGANLLYHVSADGQDWIQVGSVAKTTQFTTAPDEWGVAINSGQTTYNGAITLLSFKES